MDSKHTTQHNPTPKPRTFRSRRAGTLQAGLAVLAFSLGASGLAAEASRPTLTSREVRYLELGIEQLRRMEGKHGRLGPEFQQNLASGALASAALASESRPDAAQRREDAVRWATGALDACSKRWGNGKCARAQLPLQRVALQYPGVLPAELLTRLKAEVSASAPPPGAEAARDPWSFKETENQRMVTMARSLAAQTVAGNLSSPVAKGWGDYAKAFLLAHDREGWYEGESPGYMVLSITALLQMADHAPQAEVRSLAARQLELIFADWAQKQVNGFPAGPKSRTYSFWALSDRSTPWAAWAWMAAGIGDPDEINFMDRPELPVSLFEIPDSVVKLLAERREQPSYEIKARRRIALGKRKDLDTGLYSYATPDYILGTAQSVNGLSLGVSGGQEIMVTLFPECGRFAPVYLWSRTRNDDSDKWRSWMGQDQAVGDKNLVVARLGAGEALGHAFLGPGWSRPEVVGESGDTIVSQCGDAYVTLASPGGWEIAAAQERFPDYYSSSKLLKGSWVAVPRRQPAMVGLEAGRRAEHGDFAAWKKRAASVELTQVEGEIRFASGGIGGHRLSFVPGERASAAGKALQPEAYPRLQGPFLSSDGTGQWTFSFGGTSRRFERPAPQ
ncbi:MAG: hypothetical protein ABUT39_15345 [Acidobacteriota bacterium]